MMPWISRAIWSAPPPVPAGTTNSTGLVGSHAARAGPAAEHVASRAAAARRRAVTGWRALKREKLMTLSPGGWAARMPRASWFMNPVVVLVREPRPGSVFGSSFDYPIGAEFVG